VDLQASCTSAGSRSPLCPIALPRRGGRRGRGRSTEYAILRSRNRCTPATVNAAEALYRTLPRRRFLPLMNTTNEETTPTLRTVDPDLRLRTGVLAFVGSILFALGMGCETTPEAVRTADAPHREGTSTTQLSPPGQTSPIVHVADTGTAENKKEPMKISESGSGRNILVLHDGGGPATMTRLVAHLAEKAHVITPTHPGWNGTPRPESLKTVAALADEYVRYLDEHDVKDVLVVGSSLGGWLGAELALRDTAHRVTALVVIDGLGVNVPRDIRAAATVGKYAQNSRYRGVSVRADPFRPWRATLSDQG
jgi:hypothetical protein